jgi:DNA-binding response OmpR family regulator
VTNKILLVDDDPEILKAITKKLEEVGYKVETCENGKEVTKSIVKFKPDLVLLDVMLPGMDGYTIVNWIRESPEAQNLPIIVISALTPSKPLFESLPQVKTFFAKPFNIDDLVENVQKVLKQSEQESE